MQSKEKAENQAEARSEYFLDEQIGYLLRLATQRHTALFQQNSVADLTPTQFAALVRLIQVGSSSQNELGRKTAMDAATIKGVVDRLRKKDFVRVENDPNDKRRTLLSVSRNGQAIKDDLHRAGRMISRKTLAPLSPSERQIFLGLLKKLT